MVTPVKKLFVIFFAFIQILVPLLNTSLVYKDINFSDWSPDDAYRLEDTIVLEKDADEDFVILNITDVQLNDGEVFGRYGDLAADTIDELVARTEPDLITMTGDNAWGMYSYVALTNYLGNLGIPFAAVMGNHDGEYCFSEDWCAYRLKTAENSLFQFGPREMGFGNYIINISQDDEIIHTLYMMDTHDHADFTLSDGSVVSGYDHLWANQLEWYEWAVTGLHALTGKNVQSSVFFHIPVPEYVDAWNAAYNESAGTFNPGYEDTLGYRSEWNGHPPANNGFFALCKELGSTKDMICGHDHVNDYSVHYQGIRLTYGVKTGAGCYWDKNKCGGTTLTIHSDGTTTVEQIYVDAAALGYDADNF